MAAVTPPTSRALPLEATAIFPPQGSRELDRGAPPLESLSCTKRATAAQHIRGGEGRGAAPCLYIQTVSGSLLPVVLSPSPTHSPIPQRCEQYRDAYANVTICIDTEERSIQRLETFGGGTTITAILCKRYFPPFQ
ncbi:hypothetical protein, unlikely [Trypanosoma brucei brucei TREU927]|uniref:Uncharacterized protein n=1 Tax=Trypanosoma brucei brucei (strain 927/4 GUTat10.1) TaxID=185431 RepID=Q4GZ13_TRYB2|nr:hypothetical protein, unlikely [Trypanosoma brucei brucei TREU927]CAJ16281.1 hypothetical protein, unlikely [Trypanosoma brucei brucei TREU927]